jgi:sugar/nucleoside kinase (ribokinase family)
MNLAHTDDTQLGVFADFEPKLSEASRSAEVLFLGNIQPDLQRRVRSQANGSRLAALDSMNLWIETTRDSLVAAIGEVDCLLFNDSEIRMLTEQPNLARAARAVMDMGPRIVVAKRGEYGAVLFTPDGFFALPGFLLEDVRDPTGAGDSFAGGFLGYLDMQGTEDPSPEALRRAMAYGTVLASFNVEEFGTERVARLTEEEITTRYEELRGMTHFDAASS